MSGHPSCATKFFAKIILERPRTAIVCLLAVVAVLGFFARGFRLDASSETLVLENDRDLNYARLIDKRYGLQDYLVIAYAPKGDLFSDQTLDRLSRLRDELEQVEGVESVLSILDVPLLESPRVPIRELTGQFNTLTSPAVERSAARREFNESPLYHNLLVSPDSKTTALLINLPVDRVYHDLRAQRDELRTRKAARSLTAEERTELKQVIGRFREHRDRMRRLDHAKIDAIRRVMARHRQDADLFLGGVSMIADDLITFIKNDLKIFGAGLLFFLILTLGIIFRRMRWVLLPMMTCGLSALAMIGLLGLFDWEVTVISSNFISLQLIITMAITIHLIVSYRELHAKHPAADQRSLVLDTVELKFKPCLYAALTTIAGFGSLLFCSILPVITFGWMMTAGIAVSLVITFVFFPAASMQLPKDAPRAASDASFSLVTMLADFTIRHGALILVVSAILLLFSAVGIGRLKVENAFIDYFKKSTEIYRGMRVIDQNLGGTTPLDVVIDLDEGGAPEQPKPQPATPVQDTFDEFSEFDDQQDSRKYWLTADKMALITRVHDYLEALPASGKVLSLATMGRIAQRLNEGRPLDSLELALMFSKIPERYRRLLIDPFVSVEHQQLRFTLRVKDSEESLKRDQLLEQIRRDLVNQLGFAPDRVHLTGMLVLYNNMLQSLFGSQILTLGIVMAALTAMFLILFRSLTVALIAIFPNLFSIAVVLGFMGWMGIPLDMMTITIAAISVGIAVDDTIHYIHRFMREFRIDRSYAATVGRCHGSIGYAMYYTSVTIIIGFSILTLSNFKPSIYFGLLTGLAMFIALIAALTLLPQLIVFFKPFGPEGPRAEA